MNATHALGFALICGTIIAGCSSGGSAPPSSAGSNVAAGGPGPVGQSQLKAPVSISIAIPSKPAAATRNASYISPATYYVTVQSNQGDYTTLPCSQSSCTGTVNVSLSTTSLTVSLYGPYPQEYLLSRSTQAVTIDAGMANSFHFTFDGIASSLAVGTGTATALVVGVPTSLPITVTPKDGAGYPIVAPGNIIDSNGNILIGASGTPQTVSLASSNAHLAVITPLLWNATSYTLGSSAQWDGVDPAISPDNITLTPATTVAGDSFGSNAVTLPVVPKAMSVAADPAHPSTVYRVTQSTPYPNPPYVEVDTTVEIAPAVYPTPPATPVPVYLQLQSNYPGGGSAALQTNLCNYQYDPMTQIPTAFPSPAGATYSGASPYAFSVGVSGPTPGSPPSNVACSFTVIDSTNNVLSKTTIAIDQTQVYVQGKSRK